MTGVGITCVGAGVAGGADVCVTTTGVGGRLVLVGRTMMPVVAVGAVWAWVGAVGGAPLAGNLHAVMINAITTSAVQEIMDFLFILVSFDP